MRDTGSTSSKIKHSRESIGVVYPSSNVSKIQDSGNVFLITVESTLTESTSSVDLTTGTLVVKICVGLVDVMIGLVPIGIPVTR